MTVWVMRQSKYSTTTAKRAATIRRFRITVPSSTCEAAVPADAAVIPVPASTLKNQLIATAAMTRPIARVMARKSLGRLTVIGHKYR